MKNSCVCIFVMMASCVLADGPLTNTQIAHTLQLPNDMFVPSPSPGLRGPQMNPLRPTQPASGQVGRAPQTVGSQANHTQVPQLLQQQTGQSGLPGISQHLPTQSQVIVTYLVMKRERREMIVTYPVMKRECWDGRGELCVMFWFCLEVMCKHGKVLIKSQVWCYCSAN